MKLLIITEEQGEEVRGVLLAFAGDARGRGNAISAEMWDHRINGFDHARAAMTEVDLKELYNDWAFDHVSEWEDRYIGENFIAHLLAHVEAHGKRQDEVDVLVEYIEEHKAENPNLRLAVVEDGPKPDFSQVSGGGIIGPLHAAGIALGQEITWDNGHRKVVKMEVK